MLEALLKIKRLRGDIRVATHGPKPLAIRLSRRAAHRILHKIIG